MSEEVWKDIRDFPGYQVSNTGKVRSRIRGGRYGLHYYDEWHELKPTETGWHNKYYRVNLRKDGKMFSKPIHRLVAENFIENPDGKAFVCHKDDNGHNNNVENLYFGTPKENTRDAINNGMLQHMWDATSEAIRIPVNVDFYDPMHEKLLKSYHFRSETDASKTLKISQDVIRRCISRGGGNFCKDGYFYYITKGEK